jgi:hypothetical protein
VHLKPVRLSPGVGFALERAATVILFPLYAPLVAFIVASLWIGDRLEPPRVFRRWFAWWPTRCDPWPEEGFKGTVWLETIWRSNTAYGMRYQREDPTPEQIERVKKFW